MITRKLTVTAEFTFEGEHAKDDCQRYYEELEEAVENALEDATDGEFNLQQKPVIEVDEEDAAEDDEVYDGLG